MIEIRLNPSPSEQRQFVFIWMPAFFAFVGAMAWWRWHSPIVAAALWSVGAILMLLGVVFPALRRPLYVGWMRAAYPIGWTVSHVLLLIIFYLLITPVGLLMRLFRRDPMERHFDRQAQSYWIARDEKRPISSYFRQY